MNQKILIIVGIVFALVFVLIMAIMMNTITNEANNANDQLTNVLGMTDTVGTLYQDGGTVKGESVINAINNRNQLVSDREVAVTVVTESTTTEYDTGTGSSYKHLKYSQSDATKDDYINRTADFTVHEIKNTNGVTVGFVFDQTGADTTYDTGDLALPSES